MFHEIPAPTVLVLYIIYQWSEKAIEHWEESVINGKKIFYPIKFLFGVIYILM